VKSFVLIPGMF